MLFTFPDNMRVHNVSVGILGHVDSGKTSLVAALSTTLSTAALDKHPQSKERGITLDLGFSSFAVPLDDEATGSAQGCAEALQFTLVDCPGHASLIRTIIAGAQIIDLAVLVIDITEGIQTQTAECLVIAEIATKDLIVVLNKVDLVPKERRQAAIKATRKMVRSTLKMTKFTGCPILPVAARPVSGEFGPGEAAEAVGVHQLVAELVKRAPKEKPPPKGEFLFAADHCFKIPGVGTILTGTVLRGQVQVGEDVELPWKKVVKKVKSMQMFRRPVSSVQRGDRAGLCIPGLPASGIERALVCKPGTVPTFDCAVVAVEKIRFYADDVCSKAKFHISIAHNTVMAQLTFFGVPDTRGLPAGSGMLALTQQVGALSLNMDGHDKLAFDIGQEYVFQDKLYGLEGRPFSTITQPGGKCALESAQEAHYGPQWALMQLSTPVTAPADALIIGSKLDADLQASKCRLAFYGRVAKLVDSSDPAALKALQVYKLKQRLGVIERVERGGHRAICKGIFKKESDISRFKGMTVKTANADCGTLDGLFGRSGKISVSFVEEVKAIPDDPRIWLTFKRFVFDKVKCNVKQ